MANIQGRTIAEAVSRWLATAAARAHARVWQVGFMVGKMAPGQVFSEYFGFPCQPHFISPTSPSSQSPETGTVDQYMAAVPRGHPVWTPPPTIWIKKKWLTFILIIIHGKFFNIFECSQSVLGNMKFAFIRILINQIRRVLCPSFRVMSLSVQNGAIFTLQHQSSQLIVSLSGQLYMLWQTYEVCPKSIWLYFFPW
jgi:hypothetical protein